MNDPDIQELVRRAKNGDTEAFSAVYSCYFAPVFRYVYFRIGSKPDAEDLAQDVFLQAVRTIATYEEKGKPFLAYLYAIARNKTIDFHRKRKIPNIDYEKALHSIDPEEGPEAQAVKNDDIGRIKRLIAELPETERDAVTLRFVEGFATAEVAAILGKTEAAVRQLQSRGLKMLKSLYIKHGN